MQKIFSNEKLDSLLGILANHYFIESHLNIDLLVEEFNRVRPWLNLGGRSEVFRDSSVIPLRYFLRTRNNKNIFYTNLLRSYPTSNYELLPLTISWVKDFAYRHNSSLCWVIFSVIKPASQVYLHNDQGIYFAATNRFHLVFKSTGSKMISGGQIQVYKKGEVWLLNNKVPHEAFNDSDEERVHLIFDLLPNNYLTRFKNILLWIYWGLRPRRLWRYYFGVKFPNF